MSSTRTRSPVTPKKPLGIGKRIPSTPRKNKVVRDMPAKKGKITKGSPSSFKKAAVAIAKAGAQYLEAEARDEEEEKKDDKAEYEKERNGDDHQDAEPIGCHAPDHVQDTDMKASDDKEQKAKAEQELDIQIDARVDEHVKIIGGPLNGTCGTITSGPYKIDRNTVGYFLRTDKDKKIQAIEIEKTYPLCKFQILENVNDKHARVYSEINILRSEVMAELGKDIPILFEYKKLKKKNSQDRDGLYYNQQFVDKRFVQGTHLGHLYYKDQRIAIAAEWERRDAAGNTESIPRDFFISFEEWVKKFEIQHKRSMAKEETMKQDLVLRILAKYPLLSEPGLFQILIKSFRNIAKYGELESNEIKHIESDPEFKQGFFGLDAWKKHELTQHSEKSSPNYLVPSTLNPDCVLHWAMLITEGKRSCVHQQEFYRVTADLKEHWGMQRYKKMLAVLMLCAHGLHLISPQLYLYTELQNLYDIKPDGLTINSYEESLIRLFE